MFAIVATTFALVRTIVEVENAEAAAVKKSKD